METIDDDIADATVDYIKRQHEAGTPFFVWCNFTHMHLYTHPSRRAAGQAGLWQSEYHDAMIDHDKNVGTVLDVLDELGIADDTIVIYSTDNGPHRNTWPDAGTTPFRSEKNTNWEGAFRVPELIRWPGKIKAGSVSNDIIQHHDWLPTLLAAAGDPDVSDKLKKGHKIGDTEYKVHIDGFNLLPYLMGEVEHSPRRGFFYFSDDGDLVAMRFENWKIVFAEQRCQGTLRIWAEPFTPLRVPEVVQPAHRPLRVRRHHLEHVLRLVPAARLLRLLRNGDGGEIPRDLQRVPAAASTGELQHRPDRRRSSTNSWRGTRCWRSGTTGRRRRRSSTSSAASTTRSHAEARVAVFDNDGTLWCEKPAYIQLDFLVRRLAEQANADPSLKDKQPYKAAADGDLAWFGDAVTKHYNGDDSDVEVLAGGILSAYAGLTVEEHSERVKAFFADAKHPTLGRPYTACGYRPMVELLRYLEANGFSTYIASGGGRDFMRPVTTQMYGIPPGAGDRQFGRARLRRRPPAHHRETGVHGRRPGQTGAHLGPDRAAADLRRGQLERRHPDARAHCGRPRPVAVHAGAA